MNATLKNILTGASAALLAAVVYDQYKRWADRNGKA